MASAIAETMKEMKEIVAELKNVNARAKQLRDRKKELEASIIEYLEETETPGLKYHDFVILKAETTSKKAKSKKEKEESLSEALQALGISDVKKAKEVIDKALSSESSSVTKLKVKQSIPEVFL